jgi:hypothetical protein
VIANVANFDPVRIPTVAAQSYALTLWGYLHSKDAKRLDALARQGDDIERAEMAAFAFHMPDKLNQFRNRLRAEFTLPVTEKTREDLNREADELWTLHMSGLRPRPVS